MAFFELLLIGSVVFAVGSGKVKDLPTAARLLGQFVGRAAGGAGRIRASAIELTTKAALKPGVSDSTAALRETMAQFRAIQAEASSSMTLSGNHSFFQNQLRQQVIKPSADSASNISLRAFTNTDMPSNGELVLSQTNNHPNAKGSQEGGLTASGYPHSAGSSFNSTQFGVTDLLGLSIDAERQQRRDKYTGAV